MYKEFDQNTIIRIADGALIPADRANTDYQHYIAWLEEGCFRDGSPFQVAG